MGNKESKEVVEDYEAEQVRHIFEEKGPEGLQIYIRENLDRWKKEEVKFAITGRSATGKSCFINKVRDVKPHDDNWAKVGHGNTTQEPQRYTNPSNSRIVFWDLPGVGTTKFKREDYAKTVHLDSYDMFIIFIDTTFSEDDQWLANQLTKMKRPFCFVRSKIDIDIMNAGNDGYNKEDVIPSIRDQLLSELSGQSKGVNESKLFLISSMDTDIGDWKDFLNYFEENIPKNKFEAFVFSLPGITSSVIAKKRKALHSRIKFVALSAATVAAVPVPGLDVVLNIGIIVHELSHYRKTFGMDNLDPSLTRHLKCSKYLVSATSLPAIIQSSFPKFLALLTVESFSDIIAPIVGSVVSSVSTLVVVGYMLHTVLAQFVEDAYNLEAIIREKMK